MTVVPRPMAESTVSVPPTNPSAPHSKQAQATFGAQLGGRRVGVEPLTVVLNDS